MFSPFREFIGTVNPDAVFEQMTGIGCVYYNRRDLAEELLSIRGGGQLLVWRFDDTSFPPSWALLRQGNNLYFWVAGTVNFPQWFGNVVGTYGNVNGTFGNLVHSFFSRSAMALQAAINPNLPADYMNCNVFWAGHSYGSAIAFLLAILWKNTLPAVRVEFMGFAVPKSMTVGFTGNLPDVVLNINNELDCVAYMPPNRVLSVVQPPQQPWNFGIPVNWQTFGSSVVISQQSRLVPTPNITFDGIPTPNLVLSTAGYHPSGAYVLSTQTMWLNTVGQGQNQAIRVISNQILLMGPAQNGNVNIDSSAFIDVPQQNRDIFLNQGGGPLAPNNLNEVENFNGQLERVLPGNQILPAFSFFGRANVAYKVLFSFTDGPKSGISESWVIDALPAGKSFPQFVGDYLNVRLNLSGAQTVFEFARFSNIPADLNPTLIYPTDLAAGTKTVGSFGLQPGLEESDVGTTCLLCAKKTLTKTARMYLRGIPDSIVIEGGKVKNSAQFKDAFNAFRDYIGLNGLGFRGADPALRKKTAISSVVPNAATGIVAFTLAAATFDAPAVGAIPQHVNVRISGMIYNANLNGQMTVIVDSPTTCHSLRAVGMKTYVAPPNPVMIYNKPLTFKPVLLAIERVGERKAGRPFGTSVGRQKVKARG